MFLIQRSSSPPTPTNTILHPHIYEYSKLPIVTFTDGSMVIGVGLSFFHEHKNKNDRDECGMTNESGGVISATPNA